MIEVVTIFPFLSKIQSLGSFVNIMSSKAEPGAERGRRIRGRSDAGRGCDGGGGRGDLKVLTGGAGLTLI